MAGTALAISIDDVEVRLAWVDVSGVVLNAATWPLANFHTLIEALLKFEAETGRPLWQAQAAIAIFGTTHGESIALPRGRWTLSRAGLTSVLGIPPLIINHVCAKAWAAIGGQNVQVAPISRHAGSPRMNVRNRWLTVNIERGAGVAIVHVDDDGTLRVTESEMGHCGYAPATKLDRRLADALASPLTTVTPWEAVLTLALDSPIWTRHFPDVSHAERLEMLTGNVARFLSDAVTAHCAWGGVMITGKRIGEIVGGGLEDLLNRQFETGAKFHRSIISTPRWRLTGADLTMSGLAKVLSYISAAPARYVQGASQRA